MIEKSKTNRSSLSPVSYGSASLIAACLSWACVWLLFNMGPDGMLNNRLFEAFGIGLLPLVGFLCGLFGAGIGVHEKNWFAITTGSIGLGMIGFEVWLLLANR